MLMLSLKNVLILKQMNFFKDKAQSLLLASFNLQAYFELFFVFLDAISTERLIKRAAVCPATRGELTVRGALG